MNILQLIPMIAIVVIGITYILAMKRTHYAGGNSFIDLCRGMTLLAMFLFGEFNCIIHNGISIITLVTTLVYFAMLLAMDSVNPYKNKE